MKRRILFSILLCILLKLANIPVSFGQISLPDSIPTFPSNLKELPQSQDNKIFIKLKNSYRLDLKYSSDSGFSDENANKHFSEIFRIYGVENVQLTFKHLNTPDLSLIYTATLSDPAFKKGILQTLNKDVFIEFAEEIPLYYPFLIPNDYTNDQLYLKRINAFNAWNITTGDSTIRIAILDDAFLLTHEDLTAKVWINTNEIDGNGIDDDGNGYIDDVKGFDVSDHDADVGLPNAQTAYFQHGTTMAGISAGHTNNGVGIASLGYNSTFIPVKCRSDVVLNNSIPDGHLGLEYAIKIKPDVINLSWGGLQYSNVIQLLCNTARDSGILVLAAAGNTGTEDTIYPACNEYVISVGSTNLNDMVSAFSTFGVWLDVMAPGSHILSTQATGNDQYSFVSGTSASCAMASGLCALMKSNNPTLTVEELETCLKGGCWNINISNPNLIGKMGAGRIDALGAVVCVESPPVIICENGNTLFTCVGVPYQFNASSLGLNADSVHWSFPGGDPSSSSLLNPLVTYNFAGFFDVVLIGYNSFGSDTVTAHILAGWPEASLTALNTGQVCIGSAAYLEAHLYGNPPFTITYTDGNSNYTISDIPANEYNIMVFPTQNTTYSLIYVHDHDCEGTVSGSVTLNPVQCGPCSNTDFEFGNFSTWLGFLGNCCGNPNFIEGMTPDRQEIIGGSGYDPYSFGTVPIKCPVGDQFTVKLGNWLVGAQSEKIRKTMLITPENASFTYHYAVFLQDPPGHSQIKKPKFEVRILDQFNQLISDTCGHYQVVAGPATNGWHQNNLVRYKDWTTVGVDLSSYLGQQITVEFSTEDCGLKGHFGYAYVDASCGPMAIKLMSFCDTLDTITLKAPLGYAHYLWQPSGDTTQSISIIHPHPGDTIIVSMISVSGCISSIYHILHVLPRPSPIACCDTFICLQDTVALVAHGAGTGGIYEWTSDPPGFVSNDSIIYVHPEVDTHYFLMMYNSNGCPADSVPMLTVQVNPLLDFSIGNDITYCKGDSVKISIPFVPGIYYQWSSRPPGFSSSDTSFIVRPDGDITFILNISNGNCDFSDSLLVKEYKPYSNSPISHVKYCGGDSLLTLQCPMTSPTYQWLSTGSTTQSITIIPHNWNIYQCAFQTPQGCYDTIRYILDSIGPPDAYAGVDTFVCRGFGIQIEAIGGQMPDATYDWTSIPPGFTASGQQQFVFPDTTTQYIVKVTNGIDCNSPASYDTVVFTVIESPTFNVPDDITICKGDTIELTISIPEGFNFWTSDPPGFFSTDTTVHLDPLENTVYFLTINTASCSYSNYFTVYVTESAGLIDTIIEDFCQHADSIYLHAPDGYLSYYWPQSGNTLQDQLIPLPIDGYQYVVYLKNPSSNCKDTLVFELNQVLPPPFAVTASETTVCSGFYVQLSATVFQNGTYQWASWPPGMNATVSSVYIMPDTTTIYWCLATKGVCTVGGSVTVNVINKPNFTFGAPDTLCGGEVLFINPHVKAEAYLWSTGSLDSAIYVETSGEYILQAWNNICYAIDTMQVTFLSPEFRCPNVFTPNDDGKNDTFEIIIDDAKDFDLKIFNRWGETVYTCSDIFSSWDGKIKGKPASEGVYYYICKYWSDCQQQQLQKTGSVSLYR